MSERRASSEGARAHPRGHSPATEASQEQSDGISDANAHSVPRRRPLKARTSPNETGAPASLTGTDVDKAEKRKVKTGRPIHKKASGGVSPRISASRGVSHMDLESLENDTLGFVPSSLSRIAEDKENNPRRRRKSSTTSSSEEHAQFRPRRRPSEPLVRRVPRSKHASLKRRADSLGTLPNPSLLSVLSGLTNASNTSSSGSNSTITQSSYERSQNVKRMPTKVKRRAESNSSCQSSDHPDTEERDSSVFQYLDEGMEAQEVHPADPERPSSSSSSSTSSDGAGEHRQTAQVSPSEAESDAVDSPKVSASAVRGHPVKQAIHRDRFSNDSGISMRDSSPDANAQEPNSKHASVSHAEDDDGADSDEDEETTYHNSPHSSHSHRHHALERVPPPRLPSTTSTRSGDRHYQRLRDQEHELRQHVLQNPQPRRDFHFHGASPYSQPPVPFFDPYARSGASPANLYAPSPYAASWPPPASAPPPVGYYSPPQMPPAPYPPMADNNYAMTSRANPGPPMVAQPPPFHHPTVQPPHYQPQPTGPDLSRTTVVGYEMLAHKLTEAAEGERPGGRRVLPMYRKFENLNHRVLLHLQDEISELEEELRYLDECIAQISPQTEDGDVPPASRRAEARYGGELHYKRTDLLGRIYLKLGQYNQALSSFSTMLKTLEPANAQDIQAYHAWMEKHTPLERSETRFLEHKLDLLSLPRKASAHSIGGAHPIQSAAVGLPLILVLPLMAFAMIPGLLGRLFIIMLIGGVVVMVVASSPDLMGWMTIREWATCASA